MGVDGVLVAGVAEAVAALSAFGVTGVGSGVPVLRRWTGEGALSDGELTDDGGDASDAGSELEPTPSVGADVEVCAVLEALPPCCRVGGTGAGAAAGELAAEAGRAGAGSGAAVLRRCGTGAGSLGSGGAADVRGGTSAPDAGALGSTTAPNRAAGTVRSPAGTTSPSTGVAALSVGTGAPTARRCMAGGGTMGVLTVPLIGPLGLMPRTGVTIGMSMLEPVVGLADKPDGPGAEAVPGSVRAGAPGGTAS